MISNKEEMSIRDFQRHIEEYLRLRLVCSTVYCVTIVLQRGYSLAWRY